MSPRNLLDMNAPLYSISRDSAEAAKRDRAQALLDRDAGALSVHVPKVFYLYAARPTRPGPLPH